MCLAVPAKIVHLTESSALVDMHGNRLNVSTLLLPELAVGDWVLVHAGFAIQKLDAEAAAETFALLAQALPHTSHAAAPSLE